MSENIELKLNLLKDSPVSKNDESYYNFYHQYLSPALKKILDNSTKIETIGLFGKWGTGKSTVIKNLQTECKNKYPVLVFDTWKYQGDPLRRTFLISLLKFAIDNELFKKGEELEENFLDDLYEKYSTSDIEKVKGNDENISRFKKIVNIIKTWIKNNLFLFILSIFVIISLSLWTLSQYFLGEGNRIIANILKIPGIISLSGITVTVLTWTSKKVVEKVTELLMSSFSLEIKSQTIIRQRDYLNSPEQFEKKFIEIIKRLKQKVVIVFDNIDRVQGETAIEILSSIKTFVEPKETGNNVVFVVPCDSDSISKQFNRVSKNADSNEFLRKIFNTILWTPDFIDIDLEDFTKKQIKLLGEDYKLIDNDDVVLVINQAFRSNPREIKQFINNLVSLLFVASKTEVWSIIKDNIAFLAKVLVMRQKYPKAYEKLKEVWYAPQTVYNLLENAGAGFTDFMISTSTITATTAEPFLYFKQPNWAKDVIESEDLATALVSGNIDKTTEIFQKNIKKLDTLVNYLLSLYSKYKKPEWMINIFLSQLGAVNSLNIENLNNNYYNRTAKIIERDLWQYYRRLPVNQIFKYYINSNVDKTVKDGLVDRYISILGNKELINGNNDISQEIFENLLQINTLTDSQIEIIRTKIDENYSERIDILSLFETNAKQEKFIPRSALEKYINQINYDEEGKFNVSLSELIFYKKYINNNNLRNVLLGKIKIILQEDINRAPQSTETKRIMCNTINELFISADNIVDGAEQTVIHDICDQLIQSYNIAGSVDDKYYFLPLLNTLKKITDPTQTQNIDSKLSEFIKTANTTSINLVTDILGRLNVLKTFISENLPSIKQRAVLLGGNQLDKLYSLAAKNEKQEILIDTISQRDDLGFHFLITLTKIPGRNNIILSILNRLSVIAVQDRLGYYVWINTKIKGSDFNLKLMIVDHIINSLTSDDVQTQELGNKILNDAKFLSETHKRDIAKKVIDWLRTPGKVINSTHRNSVISISSLFNNIQTTLQKDFVFILFELLRNEGDLECLKVAIEALSMINPKWIEYEKDFTDFGENLKQWQNEQNRIYVSTELVKFKSSKPNKKETIYWSDINNLSSLKQTAIE